MNIRKASPSDARGIHELHMHSISTNCASHYTSREINAWGSRKFNEAHRVQTIEKDHMLVVAQDDKILGYSHLSQDGEHNDLT